MDVNDLLLYMVEIAAGGVESRIEYCGVSFGEKQWMMFCYDHPMFIFTEHELKMIKDMVKNRTMDYISKTRFSWLFEHTIGL